ncbi:hypothetical protein WJX81_002182 [Elliptochloris bilobata]|uniref:SAGA-associated factor 11 n=1 Tax=Elliptochloris bilobata TaxID=381761 RepID=A0AAW1S8N8_9CHLO
MAAYVKKDPAYQEALLAKRIEFVQRLKADLADSNSVAAQTVAAYTELIDELVKDVAVEVHRGVNIGLDDLRNVEANRELPPTSAVPGRSAKVDVFGQVISQQVDDVRCKHCKRLINGSRFAQHLEKCLGKGRNAARAANRRLAL